MCHHCDSRSQSDDTLCEGPLLRLRLAEALKTKGVKDVAPDRLPIDRLDFELDKNRLVFRCGDAWWACDLADFALSKHEPERTPGVGLPPNRAPRSSRRTGEDSEITFVNKSATQVELIWLSTDGGRSSYGTLGPGARRRQHTYSGHVWLAIDESGKELVVFVGEDEPLLAEIEGISRRLLEEPGRLGLPRPDSLDRSGSREVPLHGPRSRRHLRRLGGGTKLNPGDAGRSARITKNSPTSPKRTDSRANCS